MSIKNRRFSIAPMMDYTDRFCRYFHRLLSKHTVLYTEMITTGALLHGDHERQLRYDTSEHPLALQLGGSNPNELAACSRMAEQAGYDEVNLNCGCPSPRVQSGEFGASLMKNPGLVADCFKAMQDAVDIPVSIKHRIGVDEIESYSALKDFVGTIADTGCNTFIVHARKAWLKGLSPKQNREIPPLDYERVYQLKKDFPELEIIINGGITTIEESKTHLSYVDGVMMGREAYHNPYVLAQVDREIFQDQHDSISRITVLEKFADYADLQLKSGMKLSYMTRHILGLFNGMPGARQFRRYISENAHKEHAGIEVIYDALSHLNQQHQNGAVEIIQ